MPPTSPPLPSAHGLRFALLRTRWYPGILAGLEQGARATLASFGVAPEQLHVVTVPGAFELPQAASWLAREGWQGRHLDALIALGCVLRGETPHFDLVVRAAGDGLLRVALDTGVPVGLGVITADTLAQAEARSAPPPPSGGREEAPGAGAKGGNKGAEAADAAVRMALLRRALREPGA